ncbi:MAG: mechanosensitive ion channel family protein [Planctomycetia bacterium]|nr:mechanosensitive ion channel family protein [Planctomycetia bacterium]
MKKTAAAKQSESRLAEDLQRSLVEDPAALDDVQHEIAATNESRQAAEQGAQASSGRLNELQAEVRQLLIEQAAARQAADQERAQAEAAEKKLAEIENPFATRNVLAWMATCLPKLLIILLCMFMLHRGVRLFGQRVVRLMAHSGQRGSEQDRENRAQTLVGVFRNAASLIILGGGSLMLLDALSVPILPLMGGAAVFGLAVAFGAQNLIRDYFSGFMVLLEDQYSVNDVVKIGETSGLVEKITLRVTVLRDMAGVVHFVPHGAISTVSNLTHGWSRAFFDIGVAYKEDVDRVMAILVELGRELRREPTFGALILDDPEMLGVDAFADSAVVIKFFIKTRPLQQWPVRRELLRRIKNKFDALGIEIPYPHRTVYYRPEVEADGVEQAAAPGRPGAAA